MNSELPTFCHFSDGEAEAKRAQALTHSPTEAENGVWLWKSDASSVFPPHPLQEPRAEWPRQTWLGSKGQIVVDAVCLHSAEHCLRPEAQTHPLARLSELQPRAEHFKSLWSGTERASAKTGWLFRGEGGALLFRITSLRRTVNTSPLYVFKT